MSCKGRKRRKMEIQIEKIKDTEVWKEFLSKNPDCYFSAGFFIYSYNSEKYSSEFDIIIPGDKKLAVLNSDNETIKVSDTPLNSIPEELSGEIKRDINAIIKTVENELKNRKIYLDITSLMILLRSVGGKKEWNCKCITNQMSMLSLDIEDISGSVSGFKQQSFFELIRVDRS